MTKARILANLISDNAELADGQISVAEVVGAAPLASPTFTGTVTTDAVTMNGYLTVNGGGVDVNTVIYPNGIAMEDGRAISFGTGADFELSSGGTFLDHNLKDNARHLRIINGLTEHHRFSGDGNVIFNNSGADADFRVESNGNANMLFVDAGNDHVNIGSSTDRGGLLNVDGTTKGIVVRTTNSAAMELIHADNGAGTGPIMYLNRPSSSPAADDQLGRIVVQGKNNADEVIDYVRLVNQLQDPTNGSEQGRFAINTMTSGTMFSRMNIINGESVFNDESTNVDFRVESNNNANMLLVDAGNDRVVIGGTNQAAKLTVQGGTTTENTMFVYGEATGKGGRIVSIRDTRATSGTDGSAGLRLTSSPGTDYVLAKYYDGSLSHFMLTDQLGNEYITVESASNIVINQGGSSGRDFRVESGSNSHALFVDSGTSGVGIGNVASSVAHLNIDGNIAGGYGGIIRMNNDGTDGCSGFIGVTNANWSIGSEKLIIGRSIKGNGPSSSHVEMTISASEVVFNENSNDRDFRVESNGKAHMLFVDAGEDAVGINDGDPKSYPSGTQTGSATDGGQFRIGGSVGAICAPDTGNELAYTRSGLNYISSPNGGFRIRAGTSGGVNLSTTATSWTSASDERLKTLTGDIENAAEKIKTLRTKMGRYNEDPEDVSRPFLIAQDVQAVLPEAVSVIEDDPEIADTTGISDKLFLSYTDVIPLLTAALKESIAKNEELEARITALENA